MVTVHVGLLFMFGSCTTYAAPLDGNGDYSQFQNVHIMIFVGFGFLMAFLPRSSFTSTGHCLLIATYTVLWAMLNRGFWSQVYSSADWSRITLSVDKLTQAEFCAGSVLIAFGAVIGRVTASQLVIMSVIQTIGYCAIEAVTSQWMAASDIGGSMVIHAYGAYFGLAVSLALDRGVPNANDDPEPSTTTSDTLAMIGTLFLWCYWPSFNSYMGPKDTRNQHAVVNTYLSLGCSVGAVYVLCSVIHKGKFSIVEVQNATLAGGVAMGAAADMLVTPFGAMLIGTIAGATSTIGFNYGSPYLRKRIGLRDTCGVHNVHGLTGVIGGISSIIAAYMADPAIYNNHSPKLMGQVFPKRVLATNPRTGADQARWQLLMLVICVFGGICLGEITGTIMKYCETIGKTFSDAAEWVGETTPTEEKKLVDAGDSHELTVK